MSSGVKVIVWRDVLVVSDDGRGVPTDYDDLLSIGTELVTSYPHGIGLLNIIPENAVPPSDQCRAAINRALSGAEKTLVGSCWCIEGKGFQGAMVRAVLTGLNFLASTGYPRHVASSIPESLVWLLTHLDPTGGRRDEVEEAAQFIRSRRDSLRIIEGLRASSDR